MAISAQEFLKGGKAQLVAPASQNYGIEEPQQPGFTDRLKGAFEERGKNATESLNLQAEGKQGYGSTALQFLGQGAGFLGDVAGQGVMSAGKALLPKAVEQDIGILAGQVAGSKPVNNLAQKYSSWKEQNPVASRDLESIINIASVLPAAKGGQMAGKLGSKVSSVAKQELVNVSDDALKLTGKGLESVSEKIQNVVIKPTGVDIKNGFKIENVSKYDLNGPLEDVLTKSSSVLKERNVQLSEVIKTLGERPTLNLGTALEELKKSSTQVGYKGLGTKESVKKTIETIERELDEINPNWRTEEIDFLDAVEAKRAAGLNASFLHGQMKTGLTAEEKVWNNLYRILQRETERVAEGTPFKQLNKEISEIIPIEQAVIRRIPIADRNNILSLPDLINFSLSAIEPKALTIGILNRALRSGTVAKYLNKAGKSLQKSKKLNLNSGAVRQTANDFYSEARKYKSAEEFVKAQGKEVYHGTNADFQNFDIKKVGTIKYSDWGEGIYLTPSKSSADYYRGQAVSSDIIKNGSLGKELKQAEAELQKYWLGNNYDTKNENFWKANSKVNEIRKRIEDASKSGGNIKEVVLDKNIKLYRHNVVEGQTEPRLADNLKLKEKGYDGIEVYGNPTANVPEEIVIFNSDKIKTKSQLTDIWKKANKKK